MLSRGPALEVREKSKSALMFVLSLSKSNIMLPNLLSDKLVMSGKTSVKILAKLSLENPVDKLAKPAVGNSIYLKL